MGSSLRPRPPLPPALPTQAQLDELLEENAALLSAACAFQRCGRPVESMEYMRRSQVNILAMLRFLKTQRELEEPQHRHLGASEPARAIALKKPPTKRRRKSEAVPEGKGQDQQQQQSDKPLDMPSLM